MRMMVNVTSRMRGDSLSLVNFQESKIYKSGIQNIIFYESEVRTYPKEAGTA